MFGKLQVLRPVRPLLHGSGGISPLSDDALLAGARYNDERGILRYSIVTSGKRLTDEDVDRLCASYRHIAEHCGISLCASHGLISKKHCEQLKAAGVSRYHNNLETSRRNFPNVCTTHTYDDKLQTIKWALEAGLEVCSGGIMGLGETMEDRIDMYMDIAALGIKSMPVNFLTPIPGTPYADMTPWERKNSCASWPWCGSSCRTASSASPPEGTP